MIIINENNFQNEIMESGLPVFLYFWASWCPPCKMTEPLINKLYTEYSGKIKFAKVNVDMNREITDKYNVKGVPTYIIIKDSMIIDRLTGAQTEKKLRYMFTKIL